MLFNLTQSFKLAVLGVVSAAAYGSAAMDLIFPHGVPQAPIPNSYNTINVKVPLSVAAFKAAADDLSKNNMMVILLRRNGCPDCANISAALQEARYNLIKKHDRGFAVYELNAEQNPAVAALLRQRDPSAPARLHVLYNSEKIYESQGMSDNPVHLSDALEMVQALADGAVSIYDKYQPSQIFPPVSHP